MLFIIITAELKLTQGKKSLQCVVHETFFSLSFRYMGHFCGALAGFLVGLVLLENRRVRHLTKTFAQITLRLMLTFSRIIFTN